MVGVGRKSHLFMGLLLALSDGCLWLEEVFV